MKICRNCWWWNLEEKFKFKQIGHCDQTDFKPGKKTGSETCKQFKEPDEIFNQPPTN